MSRLRKILLLAAPIAVVAIAVTHDVPKAVSADDRTYIERMFTEQGVAPAFDRDSATFDSEIQAIVEVQRAVLGHAPEDKGIPEGLPREPETLYKVGYGLCYDRSRTIEKALMLIGFEVRHLAVYSTAETGSSFVSLVTPQVDSHAVSEVKTSKGWLVIDSNARWISLDADGTPWSMADLRGASKSVAPDQVWSPVNTASINPIFTRPFTYLTGLYSRHGGFYPPYTPVPDINWGDFLANFGFGE